MLKEILRFLGEKLVAGLYAIGAGLKYVFRLALASGRDLGWRRWRVVLASIFGLFFLYVIVGAIIVQRIDDDLGYRPLPPAGGSATVAMVSGLVNREARDHSWTANHPAFLPGWWIDNTPNFQRGLMGALSRFTFELRDQLGRTRGSSAMDADLEQAAGALSREPDRWIMNFSSSLLPTRPSDSFYREGAQKLDAYNARLSTGDAVFERRADNLLATMDRIALDLGASSAALDSYIREHAGGWWIDTRSDDLFYQTKGQVYGYLMILKALEEDFKDVLTERDVESLYRELVASLSAAADLSPVYIANGAADGLMANHLSMQGFYLLRARTQLREITNILLK